MKYATKTERRGIEYAQRMEMLSKLETFRPALDTYLAEQKQYPVRVAEAEAGNKELAKLREDYRRELADEFKEDADNNVGFYSNYFKVSREDMEKISKMVDMKYPLPGVRIPELPAELRAVLKYLSPDEKDDDE